MLDEVDQANANWGHLLSLKTQPNSGCVKRPQSEVVERSPLRAVIQVFCPTT